MEGFVYRSCHLLRSLLSQSVGAYPGCARLLLLRLPLLIIEDDVYLALLLLQVDGLLHIRVKAFRSYW